MELPSYISTDKDSVYLREINLRDALKLFRSVDLNRKHLSQHGNTTANLFPDLKSVQNSIRTQDIDKERWYGIWDDQTFVGSIDIRLNKDGAEIGYWLDQEYTGYGYATIAVNALTGMAVKKYSRIHAEVNNKHEASKRVLERAGYNKFAENETTSMYLYDSSVQNVGRG